MELSEESVRVHVVPLGDAWRASRLRRADAAVRILKEYALRHGKASVVKLSPKVSEKIWENGRQNPPRRIRVVLEKEDEDTVVVKLEGEKAAEEEKE
ncbi:MAG: 50S ribosomal protein L31e [Candidatus Caldarchaeum sp.]|nr:50S ribosomal protein L31e [Candidatus Caldarchaeum sp.]